jgi:predicted HTH transcriptional regulator
LRETERARSPNRSRRSRNGQGASNPFAALPSPLNDRRAKNMRACVRYLAANPGASNRQIAKALGKHEGQISIMLERMLQAGLLGKQVGGAGKTNAWTLSLAGEAAALALEQLSTRPS